MGWYRLKSAAGEDQYVFGLTGQNTTGCKVTALARCPEPWETVADDGTITADLALKAEQENAAALARMSETERFDLAVQTARAQVLDDLAAEGVITEEAATQMKAGA